MSVYDLLPQRQPGLQIVTLFVTTGQRCTLCGRVIPKSIDIYGREYACALLPVLFYLDEAIAVVCEDCPSLRGVQR